MTPSDRPTTRLSHAYVRERGKLRRVCVTITGSLIELRPQGLRSTEVVEVSSLYYRAVKDRIINEKAARRAARKAKK